MIKEAARFAAKAHEGAVRKGSHLPYIVHPMEVAMVVSAMTDDVEVIAAAYLHDVIEDANVTYEKLKETWEGRTMRKKRERRREDMEGEKAGDH